MVRKDGRVHQDIERDLIAVAHGNLLAEPLAAEDELAPPAGRRPEALPAASGEQQEKKMQEQGEEEEGQEGRTGTEEGGEDVICEVIDLYYGIEVPQVPPASPGGMFSLGSTTAAAAEADAAAKPLTKKRVLLNGVNCRLCAGDMVAVIVSFHEFNANLRYRRVWVLQTGSCRASGEPGRVVRH